MQSGPYNGLRAPNFKKGIVKIHASTSWLRFHTPLPALVISRTIKKCHSSRIFSSANTILEPEFLQATFSIIFNPHIVLMCVNERTYV